MNSQLLQQQQQATSRTVQSLPAAVAIAMQQAPLNSSQPPIQQSLSQLPPAKPQRPAPKLASVLISTEAFFVCMAHALTTGCETTVLCLYLCTQKKRK